MIIKIEDEIKRKNGETTMSASYKKLFKLLIDREMKIKELAEKAGWDEELLGLEMADLKNMDFDLSLTGFDMSEIDALIADVQERPQEDPDEDLPEAPEQPVSYRYRMYRPGLLM